MAGANANQSGDSFLVFESNCVDGKNRIDGKLIWYTKMSDGSVFENGEYSARSGSRVLNSIPTGHVYTLSNYRDPRSRELVARGCA